MIKLRLWSARSNRCILTFLTAMSARSSPPSAAQFLWSTLTLSPQRVALLLGGVALGLAILNLGVGLYDYWLNYTLPRNLVRVFSFDSENSLPTWYASTLLLTCCFLLAIAAIDKKREGDRGAIYWKVLSLIFLGLSIDETASLHEIVDRGLHLLLNTGGVLYFAWIIPGILFVAACLFGFRKLLRSLPPRTRLMFIAAGAIYVAGAIGVEALGAPVVEASGRYNLAYLFLTTVEESLELGGAIFFIYALLSYLKACTQQIQVAAHALRSRHKIQNSDI